MMQRINNKVFLSTEEIERWIPTDNGIHDNSVEPLSRFNVNGYENLERANQGSKERERERESNLILDGRGCHTKSRPTLFPFFPSQLPRGRRAREDVSPRGQQWAKPFNCIEIPVEQMCGQIRQ